MTARGWRSTSFPLRADSYSFLPPTCSAVQHHSEAEAEAEAHSLSGEMQGGCPPVPIIDMAWKRMPGKGA